MEKELLDTYHQLNFFVSYSSYYKGYGPRYIQAEDDLLLDSRSKYDTWFHEGLYLFASSVRCSSVLKSKPSNATS